MRLLCYFQGHRFNTIREQWIPPKDSDDFESLLRFDECSHCRSVRATLTHPLDFKSRFSIARPYLHRVEAPSG